MALVQSPQKVCPFLIQAPSLWVAYSGGMDSHALLHWLVLSREHLPELNVIHINHNLHEDAFLWAEHCKAVAAHYNLPFFNVSVTLECSDGESVEAVAREARLNAFKQHMGAGDCVLVGQHQDDQMETMLLHWLRGSGPQGLQSMQLKQPCGSGFLVRPFLSLSRDAIRQYAHEHHLHWLDDPSNASARFDRNYLRHIVIPKIKQRFPSAAECVARSAALVQEEKKLLDAYIAQDYHRLFEGRENTALDLERLKQFSSVHQKALFRYWLKQHQLKMPSQVRLNEMLYQALNAKQDRAPQFQWDEHVLRRYHTTLYLLKEKKKRKPCVTSWCSKPWHGETLSLPCGMDVSLETVEHAGLTLSEGRYIWRYRQGGEMCAFNGKDHRISLKAYFQMKRVLPWMRSQVPVLWDCEAQCIVFVVLKKEAMALKEGIEQQGHL